MFDFSNNHLNKDFIEALKNSSGNEQETLLIMKEADKYLLPSYRMSIFARAAQLNEGNEVIADRALRCMDKFAGSIPTKYDNCVLGRPDLEHNPEVIADVICANPDNVELAKRGFIIFSKFLSKRKNLLEKEEGLPQKNSMARIAKIHNDTKIKVLAIEKMTEVRDIVKYKGLEGALNSIVKYNIEKGINNPEVELAIVNAERDHISLSNRCYPTVLSLLSQNTINDSTKKEIVKVLSQADRMLQADGNMCFWGNDCIKSNLKHLAKKIKKEMNVECGLKNIKSTERC